MLALTRAVPRSIERCELTHLAREPIDVARAVAQHDAYESALRALGCRVERLAETPDLPTPCSWKTPRSFSTTSQSSRGPARNPGERR